MKRFHLGGGSALAPGDDGAGVAHLLSGGCGHTSDVGNNRLAHLVLDELRCFFFSRTANFADHHDGFGVGVGFECFEAIDERSSGNRIATDTDARGDADVLKFEFVQCLVGERAGAAHDAHRATGLGDFASGDADVALSGADDAGAVRAQQSHIREVALQFVEEPGFVVRRHTFGDAHDEFDSALGCFHDCVTNARSRDEDARCVGACFLHRVSNRCEHRDTVDVFASLLGVCSTDNLGAVIAIAQAVETTLRTGEALVDDLCVLVYEDAHGFLSSSSRVRQRPQRLRASWAC
ncbi:unannotated protein [freshwater metagenome]|uniref:Unannotated protein n=1 Tax=freshwater metagenome TaxID=449393 RepID=A0A6J6R3S2_9ZZZZ